MNKKNERGWGYITLHEDRDGNVSLRCEMNDDCADYYQSMNAVNLRDLAKKCLEIADRLEGVEATGQQFEPIEVNPGWSSSALAWRFFHRDDGSVMVGYEEDGEPSGLVDPSKGWHCKASPAVAAALNAYFEEHGVSTWVDSRFYRKRRIAFDKVSGTVVAIEGIYEPGMTNPASGILDEALIGLDHENEP